MPRISSLVALSVVLCCAVPARAAVPAATPAQSPSATTTQIYQTVDRAIGYLQTESAAWLKTRKCAACHHVPMPLWALGEADRRGYAIDKKFVAQTTESLVATQKPDGSWPMISRSTPDGRPGSSKLLTPITCAASSWATLALVRLVPKDN